MKLKYYYLFVLLTFAFIPYSTAQEDSLSEFTEKLPFQDFLRLVVPLAGYDWVRSIAYYESVYGKRPSLEYTVDHQSIGLTVSHRGRQNRLINEFEAIGEFIGNRNIRSPATQAARERLERESGSTGPTGLTGSTPSTPSTPSASNYDPTTYGAWLDSNIPAINVTWTGNRVNWNYDHAYDDVDSSVFINATYSGKIAGRYSADDTDTWQTRTGDLSISFSGGLDFEATISNIPGPGNISGDAEYRDRHGWELYAHGRDGSGQTVLDGALYGNMAETAAGSIYSVKGDEHFDGYFGAAK